MNENRYLSSTIANDLKKGKMVFLSGPRQVGKTTLAHIIGQEFYSVYSYLNWDVPDHRKNILAHRFSREYPLIVFDEIHKLRTFKNFLKGLYDDPKRVFHILVTGSARLDVYRRGTDSLQGRYYSYRLHPFSVAEIMHQRFSGEPFHPLAFLEENEQLNLAFRDLMLFGGFPETYLAKSAKTTRRFHSLYADRLVNGDIRDSEYVRDLARVFQLTQLLPGKVGSLLSLNSLREDLEVAHRTIALWMEILERFYYHFRIYPFVGKQARSLQKEPKVYLWDWSRVVSSSARFENVIASSLLKFVHYLADAEGYRAELWFLRDREGREVDFLVTVDRKPWFAVEAKESDMAISKSLRYYKDRLKIPFNYQIVRMEGIDFEKQDVRCVSAARFLQALV